MRLSRHSSLLYQVLALGLFTVSTSAQGNLPNLSSAADSASKAASTKSEEANKSTATNTNTRATNSAATNSAQTTGTGDDGTRGVSTTAVITGGGETASISSVPSITGASSAAATGVPKMTGLPTLSGVFKIIPASVPPSANAPYMQMSTLPEGTVFIAVGAILGFFAIGVLLWRGLVAWSLHQSVKRANENQVMSDTKALFGQAPAPLYKYSDRDSTISLSGLGGKGNRKSMRPPTAPGAASASSLFFSPTAGAAMQNPGNRGSNYLPAGYYAAGASAPGNAQSHITVGQGHGPSISLSNLGPQVQGYSRARSMGTSPPGSPAYSGDHTRGMQSSSTLNLNRGYGGEERAPSAYLEDLFDGDGALPTPGQHQGHHKTPSGRF